MKLSKKTIIVIGALVLLVLAGIIVSHILTEEELKGATIGKHSGHPM